jgi:hypothetical protein
MTKEELLEEIESYNDFFNSLKIAAKELNYLQPLNYYYDFTDFIIWMDSNHEYELYTDENYYYLEHALHRLVKLGDMYTHTFQYITSYDKSVPYINVKAEEIIIELYRYVNTLDSKEEEDNVKIKELAIQVLKEILETEDKKLSASELHDEKVKARSRQTKLELIKKLSQK